MNTSLMLHFAIVYECSAKMFFFNVVIRWDTNDTVTMNSHFWCREYTYDVNTFFVDF